jgi:hypothetical protein
MPHARVRLPLINFEKLKAYAAQQRRTLVSVLDEALEDYFKARTQPRKLSKRDLTDFSNGDQPERK